MKKRAKTIIIVIFILSVMTFTASAGWTSNYSAKYKSGNNYPSFNGVPYVKKTTSDGSGNNAIQGSEKTSWSVPRLGIVDKSNTGMTVLSSYANSPIVAYSYATIGGYYSVNIYGASNQVGTDTMKVKFDLDYS